MKKILVTIKWVLKQARPSVFSLVLMIIFEAVTSICSVGVAVTSKGLFDSASSGGMKQLMQVSLLLLTLVVIQAGLETAISIMSGRTLTVISNGMRTRLFGELSRTEWAEFSRYHSGDILTRMTSDVDTVAGSLTGIMPQTCSLCVRLGASFTALLFFDPALALLACVLGPVSVLLSRLFAGRLKKLYVKIQESESTCRSFIHEALANVIVVKAFGLEKRYCTHLEELQDRKLTCVIRRSRMSAFTGSLLSFSYWLGYLLAIMWGAMRLSQGIATFGTIAAFLQLVGQVQGPFISLAYTFPGMVSAVASAGRLMEIEDLRHEEYGGKTPHFCCTGIVAENMSFEYRKGNPVLENADFIILPGETVAVTGTSGEGKTTLIRLMLSLVKPSKGHIYFTDGLGEKVEASASTRPLISYVPQGNTLFSGSIADNLRICSPDAEDEELEAALRMAYVWEFIESLPEGMYTKIGERGLGLSEGQVQRIAIARALLRRSPVLILDEATSALDSSTEMNILKAIQRLKPAPTCIIITHRAAPLEICSRIMKIEGGRISEYGRRANEAPASEAV